MSRKITPLDFFIGLAVATFVTAPLSALLVSWAAGTMWDWFLRPQYGAGPSSAAWFGIATIAGIVLVGPLSNLAKEERNGSVTAKSIGYLLGIAIVMPVVVGSAWVVRALVW